MTGDHWLALALGLIVLGLLAYAYLTTPDEILREFTDPPPHDPGFRIIPRPPYDWHDDDPDLA